MDSIKNIIMALFGGQITMPDLTTLGVAAYAVVKSITEWFAKKKLIKADKELSVQDERIAAITNEQEQVMKAMSLMANMITTAYLSSNTIDEATKTKIGAIARDLKTISGLELTKEAMALIESTVVSQVKNINKVKEELKVEAEIANEKVVEAQENAESYVDNLRL